MPVTREQFKAAILQGGNPEGPYDIDPEVKAEVLAEIEAEKQ